MTVGDYPAALGTDHADDDANAIFLAGEGADAFGEHLSNVSIGRGYEWM